MSVEATKKVWMSKVEYDDLLDYMSRLKETVEVLSNKELIKEIHAALKRIDSGEYLTRKEMVFD